ncbi:PQQ-binding-like beta-propeller repeat protein [Streptomyces profundus]|uniref:outer membrane protein assembly factor BamB family protein n=1 Tax=Streptomyces profundus TaxID=2867410 RepID=UPI001D167BB1|nr:PQQ-binding-like beta-propeller repeat protein [Streptomyces sp. MA3_2.13]UED84952.1 PQQ-binding-like beta-propeller repeat protein [Streptomyces sp. MA3_2.13]
MAEGEGRFWLVVAPVGVVLLALLTVWVVVFSREEAAEPGDVASPGTSEVGVPVPGELAELWAAPRVAAPVRGPGAELIRLWPHDPTVALVTATGVHGYQTVDGGPVWELEPPPTAGAPCAASETVNSSGLGAVLHRSATGGCTLLVVLEVTEGEPLWWRELPAPEGEPADPAEAAGAVVAMGETTVSVSLEAEGEPAAFHRLATETGEELPLPSPPDGAEGSCTESRLPRSVHQDGNRIVVRSRCLGEPPRDEVSVYHADTGEWEWSNQATEAERFEVEGVLAGDPVLLLRAGELVAYAETGQVLWRHPIGVADGDEVRPGPLPGAHSVVTGDVLFTRYVPVSMVDPDEANPADEGAVHVAGYGLAEGEIRWTAELPAGTQLLGVDEAGGPLLAEPADGGVQRVFALDWATGERSDVGTVPFSSDLADDRQIAAFDEHQLYLLTALAAETPTVRLHAYERSAGG